jgi:PAS domain S-box-containing protein
MNKITQIIYNLLNSQNEKKSVQALIKDNQTLRSILNSLGEGVIVADRDGNFLYFNSAAENILGIGSKNVDQQEWSSVYGTYYPDKVTSYPSEQLPLARAIKGEEVTDELIFIKNPERPEGIYIEISASPLTDTKSSASGGTVIFRDVTKIKQAERGQKQSEERVKAQFKGIPIPTYVWQYRENDFVLVDYNNAAEVFTQGKIQELLGNKSSKMYADSPDIQTDFLRCYNEKITVNREMSYRFQSIGQVKDLIVSYVFVPPDIVLVHTEDVTESKKNLEALKKLSNAVEQTADSVIITNKQGLIEYVNPAFEATTGYSRKEALGQTPKILQSGMHDEAFYKNLWKIILSGKPYRGTIINKKKNGELYWSEQTITPMKDDAGNITNFVSVLKDITELREKQEQEFQLRIASELQQRLYKANVSVPGFDIAGATYSAVETNGDYFDFISMADGCIGMVVGDVSGHGIGAALVMAQTRAYLRAFAKKESDPGLLLSWLNQELAADLGKEHYVTLILARLDPKQKLLDYASAGHLPAYLLNGSGEVSHIMESTGIPLGIMRDYKFSINGSIKLSSEDIVFFLTDGITEAQALDETEFGMDRALEIIKRHRKATGKQIMEHLYQAVRSFSQNLPQEDDITSIICKVNSTS